MSTINGKSVLDHLRTRRSPKLAELQGPGPSDDELRDLLTIASRVPDHGKLVPWRFVVIQGDGRDRLNAFIGDCFDTDKPEVSEELRAEARRRMAYAPLVIAVVFCPRSHPKVPEWEQVLSVGAVCMNLIHAAKAMGYAGLWLTEWYAFDERVQRELGLVEGEQIAGFIHIGRQDGEREDRVRPEIGEIVSMY